MANKSKGEVGFVSDGDTKPRQVTVKSGGSLEKRKTSFASDGNAYTMIFSIGALCELEDDFDDVLMEINSVLTGSCKHRLSKMVKIFRAGLHDHHPELTETQVRDLMTSIGVNNVIETMAKAITLSFGDPESSGGDRPLESTPASTG
jgi:hypothetical protein